MSGGAPARRESATRRPRGARRPSSARKDRAAAPGARSSTSTGGSSDQRDAVLVLHERLSEGYGTPRPESHQPPLEEVVFTILSQNTTDTNRDRAWASLWRHFESWEEIAAAPADRVADAIAVGGLHRIKAKRIQEILGQIKVERGDFDLDDLADLDMDAARDALGRYKGVGAKSINCVLLFSLGLPAFPVDTHVHRILQRLGILETADLSKANREIQEHVPDEIAYPLHMNMIRYGREVCHARRPDCRACTIEDLCGYENKNL